jgi:hypothetical protein
MVIAQRSYAEYSGAGCVGRVVEREARRQTQVITLGSDYRPGVYFVELVQGNEKFRQNW